MTAEQGEHLGITVRQLDLLFGQVRVEAAGAVTFALAIAAALFGRAPTTKVVIILVLILAVTGGRYLLAQNYRTIPSDAVQPGRWYGLTIASLAALGAMFGALGFIAGGIDDTARSGMVLFTLVTAAFCVVPLQGGALPPILGFAIPALLPFGVVMVQSEQATASAMGKIALITPLLVVLGSLGTRRLSRRIFALDEETAQMRSHLDARREQVEKLTVSLKSNAEKRQKAELDLRRTAADLGMVKGKAQALSETLSRVSPLCPVTGVANRRTFDEHLNEEWRRMMRERKPLSLILCEVDHFDLYHENYGGQASDALLNRIAKLAGAVGRRAGDLTARFDGPRFALLLPGCDTRNAARMAEALRKRIEGLKIPHAAAKVGEHVTAHLSIATMIPTHATLPKNLIERIDTAMYEAKFQGGNRVVAYRALAKLRLERWDTKADGPLNAQSLVQKLLIWGYEGPRSVHAPGAVLPDTTYEVETICAVLSGELKIIIEGQSLVIKPGECLFIPAGVTYSGEVVGTQTMARYEAKKAA